jgi:hypothetical protein
MAEQEELTPPPEPETDTDSTPQAKKTSTPQPADASVLLMVDGIVKMNRAVNPDQANAEQLYNLIADDRPIKLTGKQAHFERGGASEHLDIACHLCWHYFATTADARKAVQKGACEVVRPDDGNPGVNPDDYCHFAFSTDGETFPMRGKTEAEEGSVSVKKKPSKQDKSSEPEPAVK